MSRWHHQFLEKGRTWLVAIGGMTLPSLVGSAITFLTTPLFALWYAPHQFGTAAAAIALGSILCTVFSLRFDIILGSDAYQFKAKQSLNVVNTIATWLCVLSLGVIIFGPVAWAHYPSFIATFAFGILIGAELSVMNCATSILVREGRYGAAGLLRLVPSVVTAAILALGLVISRASADIVVWANVLGLAASALVGATMTAERFPTSSILEISGVVREFRGYILHALPQGLLNAAGFLNLYILFVGRAYGSVESGLLFFAFRVGGFPTTLLSSALGSYANSMLSRSTRPRPELVIGVLATLSALLYAPLVAGAPLLIPHIASGRWLGVIPIIGALSLLCAFQLSVGPLIPYALGRGHGRMVLYWEVTRLLLSFGGSVLIRTIGGDFVACTWGFCGLQSVSFGILAILLIWRVRSDPQPEPDARTLEAPQQQGASIGASRLLSGVFELFKISFIELAVAFPFTRECVRWRLRHFIETAQAIFIHVPRNAGTAIATSRGEAARPHLTARFYRNLLGSMRYSDAHTFAVIRDPVDRCLSAFSFIRQGGTSSVALNPYWLARTRHLTNFDEYLSFLLANRHRINRLDYVMRTQSHFLTRKGECIVSYLFVYGLHDAQLKSFLGQLGCPELQKINASVREPCEVTEAQLATIRTIYAEDYVLLNAARGEDPLTCAKRDRSQTRTGCEAQELIAAQ